MSATLNSCCQPTCCPTVNTVNVPGTDGTAGTNGASGQNGINAFTLTTAQFTVPPDTTTPVTVSVANSTWMTLGQQIIIGQGLGVALANPGPGTFKITAIPSATAITLLWLQGANDVAAGTAISSGAVVSPAGYPALPLTIPNGGTGAITKAAAQTALGLGQNAVTSNGAGLTQAITNGQVQIGAIDVQIPALGLWQLQGWVSIDWSGVTFVASRTLTFKIRNVTQAVDLATKTVHTQILTTQNLPTSDYYLQVADSSAAVNDHIQLLVGCDTVNSAGTWQVIAANLEAVPLRKS